MKCIPQKNTLRIGPVSRSVGSVNVWRPIHRYQGNQEFKKATWDRFGHRYEGAHWRGPQVYTAFHPRPKPSKYRKRECYNDAEIRNFAQARTFSDAQLSGGGGGGRGLGAGLASFLETIMDEEEGESPPRDAPPTNP